MNEIMKKTGYRLLFLLMGGVLMGITLIYPGALGALQWVAFVPAIIALDLMAANEKMTGVKMYFYGFFFFMTIYVMAYHWFWSMYPLEFTGMSRFYAFCVILLASFGLPIFASVAGGFTFVAFFLAKRTRLFLRHPVLPFLLFAFAYSAFDWTQTLTFIGVPWGRLSIGQTENSLVLPAVSFLGSYFLTFAIVLVNALIAYAILYRKNRAYGSAVGVVGVILILGLAGNILASASSGRKVTAAGIQGNMPSSEKWGSNGMQRAVEIYTRLTDEAVKKGAELIVWPESVFPVSVNNSLAVECVKDITSRHEIDLYYGTLVYTDETNYNALVNASDGKIDLTNMYYKRHLVPFGEYVPLRPFIEIVFPMLNEISMLDDDTSPGTDSNLFVNDSGKVGGLICFDTIYDTAPLDAVRDGAELIVIGTNDSWFFDSAAGYMHNAQAKIRAAELGRYVVRSANTGISSIINAKGETIDIEGPLVEGYVIGEVEYRSARTLYSIVGNLWVWISFAAVNGALAVKALETFKRKKV